MAASREHVIPNSWYPDTTPSDLERWTVPSHRKCNSSLSANEEYVFRKLAAVTDPDEPAAAGIWNRAFKGMKSSAGRNPKDKKIREAVHRKFMASTVPVAQASQEMLKAAKRGLTNHDPARMLVQFDPDRLHAVISKIIRCISYKINDAPAPANAKVLQRMVGMEEFAVEKGQLFSSGQLHYLGDGLIINHGQLEERGLHAELVTVLLWKSIVINSIIHWDMPGKFELADPLFLD